jgi:hypothetical protein
VQIIEQTGFGTRSAVITMRRRSGGPVFLLFPMLHIGAPQFYREVHRRLAECDTVVVEGVRGARTRVLTLAYTMAGRLRRSGLVLQSEALDLSSLPGAIIRPDLTAKEFGGAWRGMSFATRLLVYVLAPVVGLWILLVGPRRALGEHVGMDDLPSPREEDMAHKELDEVLLHSRDARLVETLVNLADDPAGTAKVGVCWGAAHIPTVVRALHARGYIPRSGEWIMAIPPSWKA